jgi:hypothetical protein
VSGYYLHDAVKYLDQAAAEDDDSLRALALRHLAGQQGIGYALLSIGERLGVLADAADDGNKRLEEIADIAAMLCPGPRVRQPRWWRRLLGRRRAAPLIPADGAVLGNGQVLSAAEVALVAVVVSEASAWRRSADTSGCAACGIARGRARDNGVPDAAADLAQCRFHGRHTEQSAVLASIRARFPAAPVPDCERTGGDVS